MTAAFTSMDDLHLPQSASAMVMQRALSSSRIYASGAVATIPNIVLAPSNRRIILPFWKQPDEDSQPLDENTDIEPRAIVGDEMTAPVIARALAWGLFDLQKLFVGEDPVGAVMNAIGDYWGKDLDKIAVAVLTGFLGTTAEGGSMAGNVLDISGASGNAAYIDADSAIDAVGLMGEEQDTALAFMIVHPKTYTYMKKQNLIVTERPSDGGDPIDTYEGKIVIQSRRAPKSGSGGNTIYTTIFAGRGALGFAETEHPEGGVEKVREGLKGGGRTSLVSRKVCVLHPIGADWTPASGVPALQTVSNAELAGTGNWTRAFELENVRIVALKHKLPA
jgi:hypothetical protein